jgi:hypothetical protein
MRVREALRLNGLYVRLLLDWKDGEGETVCAGRVVAVVVPCPVSPVLPQLLLDNGGGVSPCGGGQEIFLESVVQVLYAGDAPPSAQVLPFKRHQGA